MESNIADASIVIPKLQLNTPDTPFERGDLEAASPTLPPLGSPTRLGLAFGSTATPSVGALYNRFTPQGILFDEKPMKRRPARETPQTQTQLPNIRRPSDQSFLTEFQFNTVELAEYKASPQRDEATLTIKSFGHQSPTKQPDLYESRKFQQLYLRDRHLRQLLLKNQAWDRQTIEQTFHATFLDRRLNNTY